MTTNYKDRSIKEVGVMLGGEPMQASIANISEHKMWLWFVNGEQLRLARPKTMAGDLLKIGQLVKISVEQKSGSFGKYDKYIFEGMNNHKQIKKKTLTKDRLKIEPLRAFNLGRKIWEITAISDNYITISNGLTLRKIRKPGNPTWNNVEMIIGNTYELEIIEKPTSSNKYARWLIYISG